MGYVNLGYYIGKTPKKVSGPKKISGPVQRPAKLGWPKILEPLDLDFLLLAKFFALKSWATPKNDLPSQTYRSKLSFAKKFGRLVQK